MARALPLLLIFGVLVIGGVIYAMNTASILGEEDRAGFPWKMEELRYPPHGWRVVGYYPSKPICNAAANRHRKETGKLTRCRER